MDWRYNTLWPEQLPEGQYQEVIFEGREKHWDVPAEAKYYRILGYNPKSNSLEDLNGISDGIALDFHRSNIHSFEGLSNFGKLKKIEFTYCLKLNSDVGLAQLSESLEWLHINTSKKLVPTEELFSLKKLKVLCLNSCGPLDSLDFLSHFPELVDFRFVNTNVIDGNLKPLLEHPSLVNVGFSDKRHFNVASSDIKKHFKEKNEESKIFIYNGDYRTYMHSVFKDS